MITSVHFEGWFQARFATDPDDYDDLRGKNGWTFAFDGEPDFDRVIRFETPVAPRSHSAATSVKVTRVSLGAVPVADHPLIGAQVRLLDGPKFEGHNGDIAPDGQEPIFPLHLLIAKGGVSLEVKEWLVASDLLKPLSRPRFGKGVSSMAPVDLSMLLNGLDAKAYRAQKRGKLQMDLAGAADPVMVAGLKKRIAQLDQQGIQLMALGFRVNYAFPIPPEVRLAVDVAQSLGIADPLGVPWRAAWWMGCWDADALSGYISGDLVLG